MVEESLKRHAEEFSVTGLTVTTEEQLILRVSLSTLQEENRFKSVGFYGKIFGINSDYYIAYGRGKDFIRNKKFFYSVDSRAWRFLFPPSEYDRSNFRHTRNRFTGDPTHIHRLHIAERKIEIREENRLSAAIHLMDWEATIGPRGALQIDPRSGLVETNPYFEGLQAHECDNLRSYVHHRLPRRSDEFVATSHLYSAAGDAATDFLQSVADDYPPGCWSLRCDRVGCVVNLYNLWWPGQVFYHRWRDASWGSMYIGLGDRNDDLPFMI